MKPRNKREKRIIESSATLKPITDKQWNYAKKVAFDKWGYRQKTNGTCCMECGHTFKTDGVKAICPNCNTKLKVIDTQKRSDLIFSVFTSFTRCAEYQVIRYYSMYRKINRNEPAIYNKCEITQIWMDSKGKSTVVSRIRNFGTSYNSNTDGYSWHSPLEIRGNLNRYRPGSDFTVISCTYIPEIKMKGFKGLLYGFEPTYLFEKLLTNNKLETLWKVGLYDLFYAASKMEVNDLNKYWKQIVICIRNKYQFNPKDYHTWIDYLKLLAQFNKDILNAKYVCPVDLIKEHDKYVERARIIRKKQELQEQLSQIKEFNEVYVQEKSRYLGLEIKGDKFNVKVLNDVFEFVEEGDILSHCLFSNEYFKKKNSLILSARIDNRPIETIEVSLKDFEIKQVHGRLNKNSEYHNDIISLVNSNMNTIKKIARKKQIA